MPSTKIALAWNVTGKKQRLQPIPAFASTESSAACKEGEESVQKVENKLAKARWVTDEGNRLAESGQFREAIVCWLDAIDMDGTNAVYYELISQAYMALTEDYKSIQFASKAVSLAPDWGEGHQTLARSLINFGELSIASQHLQKAIDLMGMTEELQIDCSDLKKLLDLQKATIDKRKSDIALASDADSVQALTCLSNLSLRGRSYQEDA